MRHNQAKLVVVIAFIATITGCSFKTVYNQLDYLIPEYVEGMVTLDDVLEQKVEQRTVALLNWHRNTQLKEYASWLREGQQNVGPQLTEVVVDQQIGQLEQFWRSLSRKVNEEMAQLLPLLDEKQKKELFSNIDNDNDEFREKYVELDEKERIEQYEERLLDSYERWLGALTDEQTLIVKQAAQALVSTASLRLERRLEWQSGIRTILADDDTQEGKTERLRAFLNGFEELNGDAMQEKWAVNRRIMVKLTVQIAHSLSTEHRAHFVDKTNDYIRMFTELADNR